MIHKTKKEEGKKHITMPLRWEFRLFWLDSRPISAVLAVLVTGRYDPIWLIRPNSGRINSVQRELKPSQRESEREKKKSSDAAPTRGQPRRTRVRHPPGRVHAF